MKSCVLLLCLLVVSATWAARSTCPVPEDLWCSSLEVAQRCKAVDACALKASTVSPVSVELYYESNCPGCMQFLTTQLYPVFKKLGSDVINVTLVPYGNAQETWNGTAWSFDCQHGANECLGNLIEVCAIHLLQKIETYFPFINCLENSDHFDNFNIAGPECAKQLGVDYSTIQSCVSGQLGNQLEHQLALATDALNPPHQYVPWIVFNGVHNEIIQNQAQRDLLKLVCKTYTGPKPAACPAEVRTDSEVCLR